MTDRLTLYCVYKDDEPLRGWIHQGLSCLPEQVRPTHFGEGERPRWRDEFLISDSARYEHYLKKNHESPTLFGKGFWCEAHPDWGGVAALNFYIQKPPAWIDNIISCFQALSENAAWMAAHHVDEHDFRHIFEIPLSDRPGKHNTVTCGQDCRAYVPGIYWINYFSDEYLEKHAICVEELAQRLDTPVLRWPNGYCLRMSESPNEWRTYAERVTAVIQDTPNIFARSRVNAPDEVSVYDFNSMDFSDDWP